MRIYLVIIIVFLLSSLFNDRPLQEVTEQMKTRTQTIEALIDQI